MILNSFIVSCENVTSLRIMMEHAARGRNPALSTRISHLEGASRHWLTFSANKMLCRVCCVDCGKEVNQYLSVILHKNSLLLVLVCLISTPCLHLRSLHATSRATDLENVCFSEAVLPENCLPTFISLATTAFFQLTKQIHIKTAYISTQCCHLACLGYAYRVHYNYDLPFVWNETGDHSWTKVYLLFEHDRWRVQLQ
jgi:hypothetical protein